MSWVDIGVNLTNRSFAKDLDDVIARAIEAGVSTMVVTGTSVSASRSALELAQRWRGTLYCTAGVHPHDASSFTDEVLGELRDLASLREVVAVGECGLDFNRNYSPPDSQRRALEAQLQLAAELGLPVFLHERDATDAMLEILAPVRSRLVDACVHCFTGDATALQAYLELDLHIGITGWICDERRGTHLRELVAEIPAARLMLETDAPYLLPRTLRPPPKSRRNEPAFLVHVAEAVANAREIPLHELAETTTATARRFFRLPSD